MIDLDKLDPKHPSNETPDELLSEYDHGTYEGYRFALASPEVRALCSVAYAIKAARQSAVAYSQARVSVDVSVEHLRELRLALKHDEDHLDALVRQHLLPASTPEAST